MFPSDQKSKFYLIEKSRQDLEEEYDKHNWDELRAFIDKSKPSDRFLYYERQDQSTSFSGYYIWTVEGEITTRLCVLAMMN